ncbi:hypothetical protein CKAH01_10117 [Colletotrichum kahawae]|uniref:Uncharacterized protein n=1 Tax=Colletotrichum kahawae TaxID=34407 RepID=A0AAD9XYC0_COLKA|nr:hypothetical protein CKAH01_10117 [Colletotrichum kahawae]
MRQGLFPVPLPSIETLAARQPEEARFFSSILPQTQIIQQPSHPSQNRRQEPPYPRRQDHLSPKRTPWRHLLQWNHLLSPSRDRGFPQALEMFHRVVRQG